jgi:hypothetical protein
MTAINTYAYRVRNLFVSYFIVLAFALTANLLGAYACWWSGHSDNKPFLTIVGSTKDPQIAKLFREETMGRLPLPEDGGIWS